MKRNALALGVAAAIGMIGAAQAQQNGPIPATVGNGATAANIATSYQFDRDAVGHVLIGEHFSAANGNGTNISIVNADSRNGKVVKVRMRSAVNSDDLFDFTLLMSPSDVWTGVITTNPATGQGALVTNDRSCTLPADVAGGGYNDFAVDRLPSRNLSAAELANWTREGYVEILNMADIPGPAQKVVLNNPATFGAYEMDTSSQDPANIENNWGRLFKAVKHVNGVAPCTSTVLTTGAYGDYFADMNAARKRGLDFPTGGLFGNLALLNGSTNMAFSNELAAIRAANNNGRNGQANFVWSPQNQVTITGGADRWTSDPLFRTSQVTGATRDLPAIYDGGLQINLPRITAFANDMPDLSTPYVGAAGGQNDPLNSVAALMQQLAVTSVSNEFFVNAAYGGNTDWTMSNPLRRYQVAMDYTADQLLEDLVSSYDGRVFTNPAGISGLGLVPANWVQYYDAANTSLDTRRGHRVCVATQGVTQWDREERTVVDNFETSPSVAGGLGFCGEVSVLSFGPLGSNGATNVLGARAAVSTLSNAFSEGWARINTSNPGRITGQRYVGGEGNRGLPLLGHAYMKATGVPAPGVTTNYGLSYMHRVERFGVTR